MSAKPADVYAALDRLHGAILRADQVPAIERLWMCHAIRAWLEGRASFDRALALPRVTPGKQAREKRRRLLARLRAELPPASDFATATVIESMIAGRYPPPTDQAAALLEQLRACDPPRSSRRICDALKARTNSEELPSAAPPSLP